MCPTKMTTKRKIYPTKLDVSDKNYKKPQDMSDNNNNLLGIFVLKCSFLYGAVSSPLDRSKRFTLFAFPGRPVHSDTNSASPGSILAMQQLRATTKSLSYPPLSIVRYSFIQLSQQGRQWRERKCPTFDTVAKRDSNPVSLDCESGIVPLSYRAPLFSEKTHTSMGI